MENVDIWLGVVAPYINFAIFIFLALKLFKKPILGLLSAKKDDYEKLLNEAKKAREEAVAQKESLEKRLASIDDEINKMKSDAKAIAEKDAEDIVEKAKALAAHLETEAQRVAEAQLQEAQQTIRHEIVEKVKVAVSQKLGSDLSEDGHAKVIGQKINDLGGIKREAF